MPSVSSTTLSPASGPGELYLHRGQLDDARELLGRFAVWEHSEDLQVRGCYQAALAAVRLAEGNAREALAAGEAAFDTRDAHGIATQHAKLGLLHALEAALALGEHTKVDALLATVEEQPIGLRPPFLDALTHRFRALLAGDDPSADPLFRTAATRLRELGLPF